MIVAIYDESRSLEKAKGLLFWYNEEVNAEPPSEEDFQRVAE